MDREVELALYGRLLREPKLKEWLQAKLDAEVSVLLVNPDVEALRKAQGRAQLLQHMLDLLDAAAKRSA